MSTQPDVRAAGAVVLRRGEVLLVHRPKYDDWSFPKGKLDRGEHALAAAVREVEEETGVAIRLGRPLTRQRYPVAGGRTKVVDYWVGRVVGDHDVSGYAANAEVDEVRWVPRAEARELLTYPHDRLTLREAVRKRRRTTTVVLLRHAKARSRAHWRADDRFRPLLKTGAAQADRLVPLLAAYDVTRLVSSSSARCVASVVPYADASGRKIVTEDELSEEDATLDAVTDLVQKIVDEGKRTVLCTHRPVLPAVFDVLGVEDPRLEPGEMVVVHLRRGEVVDLERHQVR